MRSEFVQVSVAVTKDKSKKDEAYYEDGYVNISKVKFIRSIGEGKQLINFVDGSEILVKNMMLKQTDEKKDDK